MPADERDEDATEVGQLRVFPSVKKDDPEDVSWALSTAEAMWSRGDHVESVKWIRRAAEAASEFERDDRALELAKVAAELASLPAQAAGTVVVAKAAGAPVAPPVTIKQAPPPVPSPKRSAPPPPMPPAASSAPPPPAKPSDPSRAPSPPKAPAAPAAAQGIVPKAPASKPSEGKKGGRRSVPNLADHAKVIVETRIAHLDAEATSEVEVPIVPDTKPKKKAKPQTEERSTVVAPEPMSPAVARLASEDMDAWPTQSIKEQGFDEVTTERTRLASPVYQEKAIAKTGSGKMKVAAPVQEVKPMQAVRVVLWRDGNGELRIAPAGKRVSAVTMEAVLVATDPGADLLAWLGTTTS